VFFFVFLCWGCFSAIRAQKHHKTVSKGFYKKIQKLIFYRKSSKTPLKIYIQNTYLALVPFWSLTCLIHPPTTGSPICLALGHLPTLYATTHNHQGPPDVHASRGRRSGLAARKAWTLEPCRLRSLNALCTSGLDLNFKICVLNFWIRRGCSSLKAKRVLYRC
jgi:hypothetical protein